MVYGYDPRGRERPPAKPFLQAAFGIGGDREEYQKKRNLLAKMNKERASDIRDMRKAFRAGPGNDGLRHDLKKLEESIDRKYGWRRLKPNHPHYEKRKMAAHKEFDTKRDLWERQQLRAKYEEYDKRKRQIIRNPQAVDEPTESKGLLGHLFG